VVHLPERVRQEYQEVKEFRDNYKRHLFFYKIEYFFFVIYKDISRKPGHGQYDSGYGPYRKINEPHKPAYIADYEKAYDLGKKVSFVV
jgi:hypothetical protein